MNMDKKIVLLADNDSELVDSLIQELVSEGYTVETAQRLGDILEKVVKQRISLMVINLAIFPDCEIISAVKKIDKNIPIITIIDNDSLDIQKKVRQEGVFFYFVKPFTIEDMIIVINSAFS